MSTSPAICHRCKKIRKLKFGNPPTCKCGCKRVSWLEPREGETLQQCATRAIERIDADYQRAGEVA